MAPKKKRPPIEAGKLAARKTRMENRRDRNRKANEARHKDNLDRIMGNTVNPRYTDEGPRKGKFKSPSKIARTMRRRTASVEHAEAAELSGLPPMAHTTAEHLAHSARKLKAAAKAAAGR